MTWYEKDLVVMRVSVPRGMAQKASLPGSFVFLKAPGTEDFFFIPVSVLRSDPESGFIEMAVKITGPKTKALEGQECIEMKGIYRNGLLGVEKLTSADPKKVLCLTKGIGLAPLINYCRWAAGKDNIDFIVDTEKIGRKFAEACLGECLVGSVRYEHLPLQISSAEMEKYDVIVISASDFYQHNIYVPDFKKVLSNNCSMCCGEGVCGACIRTDAAGRNHRMCKCMKL